MIQESRSQTHPDKCLARVKTGRGGGELSCLPQRLVREIGPATRAVASQASLSLQLLENEAKRIAHALHDEAGQLVTLLGLKLAESLRHAPPHCAACLRDMAELINKLEQQIRDFSHELRPAILDDYGIIPTLEYLARGVAERTGIAIEIRGAEVFGERPSSLVETVLYRSVQEALINIKRHAQARRVTIRFRRSAQVLYCTVQDDGVGFDPKSAKGLGLVGMRQRIESVGGRLVIRSRPGSGVTLKISVPFGDQYCHLF